MPSAPQHLRQARLNERLADTLVVGKLLDWAVTALFYAALHYTDAYLDAQEIHPRNHQQRRAVMGMYFNAETVACYGALEKASRRTRYDCFDPTSDEYNKTKLTLFDPVKQAALALQGAT